MKLFTIKELKILVSELRVSDPTLNKDLTKKQKDNIYNVYNNLINKLDREIFRREKYKLSNTYKE